MAENIGGIEYEIKADAGSLLEAGRVVKTATGKMQKFELRRMINDGEIR